MIGALHAFSSTICRMKIIIFFVLAGLSLAEDTCQKGNSLDKQGCLEFARKQFPEFRKDMVTFMCAHYSEFIDNKERYEAACVGVFQTLKCADCPADTLFGQGVTYEELLKDPQNALSALENHPNNTEFIGLNEDAAILLCKLLGGDFLSTCMTQQPGDVFEDFIKALNDVFSEEDGHTYSEKELLKCLKQYGCISDVPIDTASNQLDCDADYDDSTHHADKPKHFGHMGDDDTEDTDSNQLDCDADYNNPTPNKENSKEFHLEDVSFHKLSVNSKN